MKYLKKIVLIMSVLLLLFACSTSSNAVYDPLSVSNNKIGVHILFPTELQKAKELVNSSGGDWGYVTIPIQAGDKDLRKWQNFMNEAKDLHLIPIVRLATEGDYFQRESWRKPKDEDIVDFANFLDSLNWPVKNRYVIILNEVNRADEWQGKANPSEYAKILSFASTIFKSKNQDYFIISSGMDNAASTGEGTYSQYDFFKLMEESVPGIFNQIDGFSSHSYPNPAFSQPPKTMTRQSISSFIFEKEYIDLITSKKLPVFITETGWDQHVVSEKTTAEYFKEALNGVWNNPEIAAITPFLLHAGPGPFEKFSLINNDGHKNEVFKAIESIKKTSGTPLQNQFKKILDSNIENLPVKNFSNNKNNDDGKELKYFVKWLFIPI